MEPPWIQELRNIVNKQKLNIVDGIINPDHRLILKRRDGSEVDAGEIKVKPPGMLVYIAGKNYGADPEPTVYVSKDGSIWTPGQVQGESLSEVGNANIDGGCWTGDRWLVGMKQHRFHWDAWTMLQSRDGVNWVYHPDEVTFNPDRFNMTIHCINASGNGVVVAVGQYFGADEMSNVAISRDFGETWSVLPFDPVLYPFNETGFNFLTAVYVKNDSEWVVLNRSYEAWYTQDSGAHFTKIRFPSSFNLNSTDWGSSITFFNDYWWLYGSGSGAWNTCLLRSKDLVVWEKVMTVWNGNYPPFVTFKGSSSFPSGTIYIFEHDPITNNVIAVGFSQTRASGDTNNFPHIMVSTDGGENWVEVAKPSYAHYKTDYGWAGFYNWRENWKFFPVLGARFAYGWWYVLNGWGGFNEHGSNVPPIIRISPDGSISEPVFLPHQFTRAPGILLSRGDLT